MEEQVEDGVFTKKVGSLKKSGCYQNLCVADKVINKVRNAGANIIGIKGDNTFMLLFISSEIANLIYSNRILIFMLKNII